ncbi:MAG: hypothetical protein J7503_06975 [Cellulomonas iranensis]|uniref:hypothetical protein n=1 Tax=Cellulomonas iranensis TaxID=76862 RepID=UPI001B285D88|nr:hypothetical protein [Cellulomonas iranensis]MBO9568552.1 hypothetical protein [Cellulomonas iranensis]
MSAGSSQAGDLRQWWAAPLVVVLGGMLPVVVGLQRGTGERDLAFVLQLLLTAYAGTRLAFVLLRGLTRPLQGAFWLFVYTAMGIAPLAQLVIGQFPTLFVGTRDHLTTAILLVLVGCVAFDVAELVVARRRPAASGARGSTDADGAVAARVAPAAPPSPRGRAVTGPPSDLRPYRLLVAGSAVALLVSVALVVRLGGPATFFSSRQAISESIGAAGLADAGSQVGSALLRGGGTMPVLVMLLALTRVLLTVRPARRSVVLVGTWLALLGANVVVNNPVSNPRYWALTVLLSTVFVLVGARRGWYRTVLVGGLVAAVVVFPYADRFRYDEAGYRPLESQSVLTTMAMKDFDQMVMVANTVTYTQVGEGHTGGRQLLGAVLFFVPRQVWPGKAQDTGVLVGEWMGTVNTNLSSPWWAELWVDGGWVAVVLGSAALGLAAARADRRYLVALRRARVSDPVLVVVPVVAGYAFILLRGSLLQAMGRLAILAACGLVLVLWDRQMRRWSDADEAAPTVAARGAVPSRSVGAARSSGRADPRSRAARTHSATALSAEPSARPQAAPSTPPTR